jgi:metal-responsive CopG/Arc/MetJ family transcriptional regulator
MKTAVSIPDPLFKAADRASKRLKVSRSKLYAQALEEFLRSRTSMTVREKLDEVYGSESSELDPVLAEMQRRSIERKR